MVRALLLVFLAFTFTANAEFRGTLASWDQMKQMTPKQRRKYIDGYRQLVMMMAEQERKLGLVADTRDLEFNEQVAIMMNYFSILPTAEAEAAKKREIIPQKNITTGNWNCEQYDTANEHYIFHTSAGTCVKLQEQSGLKSWFVGNAGAKPEVLENWKEGSCPAGTEGVPSPKGAGFQLCVPNESINRMAAHSRTDLRRGKFLAQDDLKRMTPEDQERIVLGGIAEEKKHQENLAAFNQAEEKKKLAEKAEIQANAGKYVDGYYGKEAENLAAQAEAQQASSAWQTATSTASDAAPATPVPGIGDDPCPEPKDRACKQGTDAADIGNWRKEKDGENACVMGGFFSEYKSKGQRVPGGCKEITQFPQNSKNPLKKCNPKTETMCNPFLFCMVTKDAKGVETPFLKCEKKVDGSKGEKNSDVTKRCQAVWNNHPGKCYATDFDMKDDSEFSKEWNTQKKDFEDNFNKRCFSGKDKQGFEALFCDECNRMKSILYKMNKERFKFGCASKPVVNPGPAPAKTTAPVAPAAPGEIPPPPPPGTATK